jgi:hypothetical protein
MIADATSQLSAGFVRQDSTEENLRQLGHYIEQHGRPERAFQTAQDRLVKGLQAVAAQDLETANAYLQQVFVPLWNQRFPYPPQMAGDAHPALLPGTNLASVLSIRERRTVAGDYTVQWQGAMDRVQRAPIARGMRGARVPLERRLDGRRWMHAKAIGATRTL